MKVKNENRQDVLSA